MTLSIKADTCGSAYTSHVLRHSTQQSIGTAHVPYFCDLLQRLKKQNPAAVKGSGVLCQTPFGVERIALSYQDK